MGNQLAAQYQVTRPLDLSWQEVVLDQKIADSLNYILLRNTKTNEEAQQYILNIPSDTLEEELRKYNLRCLQNLQLVKVIAVENDGDAGVCAVMKNRLRVIVERIVNTLATHPRLNEEQAKTVLLKSLIGFKAIFEFEGYMPVHNKLIFFNQSSEVKVWMNEDLPINKPETGKYGLKPNGSEAQMVSEIISTIESHVINIKQYSLIKKLIIADGQLSFEKAISVLSSRALRQRGVSPIALLSGLGPRVDQFIHQIQSQGLKVINAREAKRYIQQPGKIMYKQVQQAKTSVVNIQNIPTVKKVNSQIQTNRTIHNIKSLDYLRPSQSRVNTSPAKIHRNIVSRNSPSARMVASSPQRIQPTKQIIYKTNTLISSGHSPIRRPSIQMSRRVASPVPSQQTVYYTHQNVRKSPSPRNSIRTIQEQVVTSASPYFQQAKSHIVFQPIIRTCKKNVDISKISRVSSHSKSSNKSRQRVFPPRIVISRLQAQIVPHPSPSYNIDESQDLINQPSGFIKDSAILSNLSPLRKQPSIEKSLSIFNQTPPQIDNIQDNNAIQQTSTPPEQSIQGASSRTKQKVEWIKITNKIQTPTLMKHESKSSNSKVPTQVPNSPLTPQDILISYNSQNDIMNGNKFSMADLLKQLPSNEYGVQVDTMPSNQDSNKNSQLNMSGQSNFSKKKMVIYTDTATIHCDDAVIQKGNQTYKLQPSQDQSYLERSNKKD